MSYERASQHHPLEAFSVYLSGRNQVLLSLAREIVEKLDASASSGGASALATRARASDLLWLWTLGAYEVTRTMSQARECFSETFSKELSGLKVDLEKVRVPNAKLERIKYDRRERTIPVDSNRASDVWDEAHRDLLVGDPLNMVSGRMLLTKFEVVMASMTADDVRMSHEASFARR